MNYNLVGLVRLGFSVADRIEPGSSELARGLLDMASGEVGVDVQTDLLDLITGEMVSYWVDVSEQGEQQGNV